ncbi:MAG: DUF502 domain-containing protein [Nitrospinales bacterium]
MVRFISKNIITGLVTLLPVALTLYFLYWMAASSEIALSRLIKLVLPDRMYWPGMGLVVGIGVLFVLGMLMRTYVMQLLFSKGEQLLYHTPLVKSLYSAIRDLFDFFSPTSKKEFEQVVSVDIGNTGMKVIGFVTQTLPEKMPKDFREDDSILIYLPLSYMIGGYALLVPRSAVSPVDMSMEEAMRFTLTAGVTGGTGGTK